MPRKLQKGRDDFYIWDEKTMYNLQLICLYYRKYVTEFSNQKTKNNYWETINNRQPELEEIRVEKTKS